MPRERPWAALPSPPPSTAGRLPDGVDARERSSLPPRRRRVPAWVYGIFFLGSAYTILVAGVSVSGSPPGRFVGWPGLFIVVLELDSLLAGLPYAAWLIGILGCHELGHYVACRIYGIDATPPLFLPGPQFPFGTLGAFIRIRAPFPNRTALFDVGAAGPLAGFAWTVPALVYGYSRSQIVPTDGSAGIEIGESLLSIALARWVAPPMPEGTTLLLHPAAYAGWVGLFATALNLLPIGQLDGGHLTYAISRGAHRVISRFTAAGLLALGVIYLPWIFWGLLLWILMGSRHPPLLDEEAPLPASRRALAVLCLLILLLCFIPAPFPGLAGGVADGP